MNPEGLVAELATVQRIDALYQLVQAQKGVDASSSFTSAQRWAGVPVGQRASPPNRRNTRHFPLLANR
jgi:hypothetical protein